MSFVISVTADVTKGFITSLDWNRLPGLYSVDVKCLLYNMSLNLYNTSVTGRSLEKNIGNDGILDK